MDTDTGITIPGGRGIGRRAIGRLAAVARVGALGVVGGVLLFAALLGTAGTASAAPLSTSSSGWTPGNFDSSCKASGGKSREIKQTNPESGQVDVHYSYCDFGSGGRNQCDWIKKTCTFGIVAQPQRLQVTSRGTAGTLQLSADGSAGAGGQGTHGADAGANGGGTALAADDDDER